MPLVLVLGPPVPVLFPSPGLLNHLLYHLSPKPHSSLSPGFTTIARFHFVLKVPDGVCGLEYLRIQWDEKCVYYMIPKHDG